MTVDGGRAPRIAVLADDLTSAGDGAAPFRRTGHDARILFRLPEAAAGRTRGVTAVDLGTRVTGEETAAARTRRAARLFADAAVLLKTVDSTLRGHVAAEIRAARSGSGRRAVIVAPAFPAEGRVTVDGVQYVRGIPVHESEFARDPAHPVRCSDLGQLLPDAVPVGPDGAAELPRLIGAGAVVAYSARQDADLDLLIASVPRLDEVLWVGSPGLAAALARHCTRAAAAPPTPAPAPARRPLIVVGSANPATRRQLALLRDRVDVHAVTATDDPAAAVADLNRMTAPVLTLHTPDERRSRDTARALGRSMAEAVRRLIEEARVDALVLTGGETAAEVLDALGAVGITLADEPEPGVARGTLLGRPALPVLIKAGGFGDDATLVRLCHLVRQRSSD
ncbi:four-carbon acid sugar kinase family protein [Streptomyces sp. BR123]|uniref:four-carbon acid sugar kinase family protein n=1 Tax=Streptomyces sp. BR123 TaxID=2749828 RepID=UPI0015C4B282|nr:four-carbon acid sugar kinase family protein [Streptomyces sp. BR123]NXY98247.1 four-carbon acid sugar kinase family protein [Streptomyces sp. BR123]